MAIEVEVLTVEDCPSQPLLEERLQALTADADVVVTHRVVRTPAEAERTGFVGSPTVRINGRDPFATGDERVGLGCRLYATPQGLRGVPSLEQLRAALADAGS